jgi:hypothetical protein
MWEFLEDALMDSLKMLPFLFTAYLTLEYIEHKSSDKLVEGLRKFGVVGGAVLGSVPQCGFSVAASNLYAGRIISAGTLAAVFISTSDEAIPILLSSKADFKLILSLIAVKIVLAAMAGLMADSVFAGLFKVKIKEGIASSIHRHVCTDCGCHGEEGILKPALKHTVNIFIFLFFTNLFLNFLIGLAGEENLSEMAGMIGLIPNCAASIILTRLYIEGSISFGSAIAGLSTGAGAGLLVLFRMNRNIKENVKIISYIYVFSVLAGFLIQMLI